MKDTNLGSRAGVTFLLYNTDCGGSISLTIEKQDRVCSGKRTRSQAEWPPLNSELETPHVH